ncbi:MAG: hypothetical protein ACLSVD_02535 [Eggerthellaceae bacterium]
MVASLGALGSTSASAVRAALEIGAKAAELVVLDQGIDTSRRSTGRSSGMPPPSWASTRTGKDLRQAQAHRRQVEGRPQRPGQRHRHVSERRAQAVEITAATGISRSTLYRNLPKGGDGDG